MLESLFLNNVAGLRHVIQVLRYKCFVMHFDAVVLQQMLQDFSGVSDHFGTLCINGLKSVFVLIFTPTVFQKQ